MNSISKELQEEIIEALNFTVNAGYYDEKEILEVATEYLSEIFEEFDLPVPSSEVITEIIGQISERKLVETKQKNFERLQKIFDQLNCEGIIAIDYAGFDMSEGHEAGAEGVILGCTEIGLLIQPADVPIPVFDTTEIHSQQAVEFALSE
jgi:hypothetical protein